MQAQAAPAMVGEEEEEEVVSVSTADEELFDLYPNPLFEKIARGYCGLASSSDSDGVEQVAASTNLTFNFNTDPTWLIDPSSVMLGEIIGEGPRSIVYQGLYKSKPVAVKVIQPDRTVAVSPERWEKFQREVSLLSKLKHENVVNFIGACFEPSMMILIELMRGGSLQKYLWNMRPETLDLKLSISFALDICRAVEYLHTNGIIHRDLKPANLLLTEDMKQIKLADFGNAREEIAGAMTSEAGTYRWMAPELFSEEPLPRGAKKQYDHKADVYSFSIVLWELLMNQTPFKGRNSVMVAYASAKKIRPDLDDIPPGIIPLLESCWAQDPTIRPEFAQITDYLSDFYRELCSTKELEPSNVIESEAEHCWSNLNEEEPPVTNIVINRPNDMKLKRRKKSLSDILFNFCNCKCVAE